MTGPESLALMTLIAFGGTTVFVLARAVAKRIEGGAAKPAALTAETQAPMERMERALESVSIEIERISESQRFLTKVLSEREPPSLVAGHGSTPRNGSIQ